MDSAAARARASAGGHSSTAPAYTEFHPRWYRPRISTYWWLGRWPYVKFILRELSSVAVAWTVAFGFLLLHSITWFNLAPKAMAVRVSGKRLPAILISGPQFLAWFAISAIVLWIYMVRT